MYKPSPLGNKIVLPGPAPTMCNCPGQVLKLYVTGDASLNVPGGNWTLPVAAAAEENAAELSLVPVGSAPNSRGSATPIGNCASQHLPSALCTCEPLSPAPALSEHAELLG